MKDEEATFFVTEDKWMREEGGQLDPTDKEILDQASEGGKVEVKVITIRQMLEQMEKTEPEKYKEFNKEMSAHFGSLKRLSSEEVIQLAQQADSRMSEFELIVRGILIPEQAKLIRTWRIDDKMTWRSVARACYYQHWPNLDDWKPPSNQLMGMALCQEAALFFKENYRELPWN